MHCNKAECIVIENSREIVRREKNKKIVLINNAAKCVKIIRIDNCVVIDEQKKCDWLFEIDCESLKWVIYVELKGNKLRDALEQISACLHLCKKYHYRCKKTVAIILSRYPQEDSQIQREKVKLKEQGIELKIKTKQMEIKI